MSVCRFGRFQCFLVLAALSTLLPGSTQAANVLHRYTFNDGTINDSVGAANGTLFVPSNPAFAATFNAGRLDLRANAGGTPQAIIANTNGAFVELPDGVFTSSVNAGTSGAVSIEAWVNVEQNRQNARIWSFGDSQPNGPNPYWGQNTDWVDLNGQTGGGRLALTTHVPAQGFNVNELQYSGTLPTGALHHVVATFDQNDTQGGINPDGTMRLYVNNVAIEDPIVAGSGFPISVAMPLGFINDVNNYIGRSQWSDPLFDGQIDELAIYDAALTPAEVASRFAAGPVPTPIPTFVVNRATGDVSVENHTSINFRLKNYSISSAAGGLDAVSWESISDTGDANSGDMGFDPINIWTEQSATATQLAESTTGNGGLLAATTGSRSLGDAWFRTPFQDLVATFVLSDGATGTADVAYTGAPIARSDLNGDGALTPADWTLFLAGSDANFVGQTRVQSFRGGDVNGDFVNDFRDFRLFQSDYIAAHGAAAFAELANGQVPEPTALALAIFGLTGFIRARRRHKALLMIMCVICAGTIGGNIAIAATPATYVASADPGLAPDANANVDDAWAVTLSPTGGRGSFQGFAELGIGSAWVMYSYPSGGINGSAQSDHTFVGGPLATGQSVKLDFANSAIAAGSSVGISLTSGGSPVATMKFVGGDPQGVYRYDDLGGIDQNTGETFAYRTPAKFEFSINGSGNYTAAYGLSSWSGSFNGSVDGIRVFNNAGGDGSDVIWNNMAIGATSLVPLSLEVNKTNGNVNIKGNPSLVANIDYYRITSGASALDSVLWNSLDQQNLFALDGDDPGTTAGDSPTEGWDKATNATDSRLTEYFLRAGGAAVASGSMLSLGQAYDKTVFGAADGDLQFVYGIAGGPRLTGLVTYITSGGVTGDYNENGVVDAADFVVWRKHLGQAFTLPNRDPANGTGPISTADYGSWRSRFGNTSGSGASLAPAGVPEPATAWLLLLGILLCFGVRHRW